MLKANRLRSRRYWWCEMVSRRFKNSNLGRNKSFGKAWDLFNQWLTVSRNNKPFGDS